MHRTSTINFLLRHRLWLVFGFLFLVSGCYFPDRYTTDIVIDQNGNASISYDGQLMSINILQKLNDNPDITQSEYEALVARQILDIQRSGGIQEVSHVQGAHFQIKYQYQFNVYEVKYFALFNRNMRFLTTRLRDNGLLEIATSKAPDGYIRDLESIGFRPKGRLRIQTNWIPVETNGTVASDVPGGLIWEFDGLRQEPAKLVLKTP